MLKHKKIFGFLLKYFCFKTKYEVVESVTPIEKEKIYYYNYESDLRLWFKIVLLIVVGTLMIPFKGLLYYKELYGGLFNDFKFTGQLSSRKLLTKNEVIYNS